MMGDRAFPFVLCRMRRLAVVLFAVLVPAAAWPCTCTGPTGRAALADAAAVFSGKALAVEFEEKDAAGREPKIRVTFEVRQVWKGDLGPQVAIRTVHNRASCNGYAFEAGQEYLVTAYEKLSAEPKSGIVREVGGINTCGGTGLLAQKGTETEDLGPGRQPRRDPR